ncbi:MAG: DCC1-like thiol-disulfide oxidoreductase family protein [Candidatus Limnocylindrales bacterium]
MDRSGTLLYDADCGLCVATATWLAGWVAPSSLGLLPLQQVAASPEIAALVEGRDLAAQLHFVRADGAILAGAQAALAAGRLVPALGLYAGLLDRPLGHALLEPLYREIASHRRRIGRLLGLPAECPLPTRSR